MESLEQSADSIAQILQDIERVAVEIEERIKKRFDVVSNGRLCPKFN